MVRNLSEWTYRFQCEVVAGGSAVAWETNCCRVPYQDLTERLQSYKDNRFWESHIENIVQLCLNCENQGLLVELLGILRNLSVFDLPDTCSWHDIASSFSLHNFVGKLLLPGMAACDVLLETMMFIRRICTDEDTATSLINGNIVKNVCRIWGEHETDPELVLHIILLVSQLLRFHPTAELTLGTPGSFSHDNTRQVIPYLLFLYDFVSFTHIVKNLVGYNRSIGKTCWLLQQSSCKSERSGR